MYKNFELLYNKEGKRVNIQSDIFLMELLLQLAKFFIYTKYTNVSYFKT